MLNSRRLTSAYKSRTIYSIIFPDDEIAFLTDDGIIDSRRNPYRYKSIRLRQESTAPHMDIIGLGWICMDRTS